MIFFYEKESRFNPRLIHKSHFIIGQVPIEKYGLKILFLVFNTLKIETVLLKCPPPPPPPPVTKLILLHTVVVLYFTHHIKQHDWSRGERCQSAQKHFMIKTY